MARILALDYGAKRVGIAVSDPLGIIANPLVTTPTGETLDFVVNYHRENPLEKIVIGEPLRLNGEHSAIWEKIQKFAAKLQEKLPEVQIIFADERFTSKLASAAIAQSGLPRHKRQSKELIDRTAATIILQSYLQ